MATKLLSFDADFLLVEKMKNFAIPEEILDETLENLEQKGLFKLNEKGRWNYTGN